MNISQVKKLRKIVRIKKLATKNNKIFVCTMKKTSVHYKMVLTIIPCLFIPLPHFQYREDIYAHPCFQAFPKQFTNDYLSNHLYGQEARKFSYNTHSSILKCSWRGRRMDGQSSIGTGIKLQRPSTSIKAQYSPSASVVFQMRYWWPTSIGDLS